MMKCELNQSRNAILLKSYFCTGVPPRIHCISSEYPPEENHDVNASDFSNILDKVKKCYFTKKNT